MNKLLSVSLVTVIFIISCSVRADIYRFSDSNGVYDFSSFPKDSRYKLVMRMPVYKINRAVQSYRLNSTCYRFSMRRRKSYLHYSNVIMSRMRFSWTNARHRQIFSADVNRIAVQYQINPALLHAVVSVESSYNPLIVSQKGAIGLMQLMPKTAERFGIVNPTDPIANIYGGARYLRWLLDKFNDTGLAIAAYNAGESTVKKYGNQIPPYLETQVYVLRVLDLYRKYKRHCCEKMLGIPTSST